MGPHCSTCECSSHEEKRLASALGHVGLAVNPDRTELFGEGVIVGLYLQPSYYLALPSGEAFSWVTSQVVVGDQMPSDTYADIVHAWSRFNQAKNRRMNLGWRALT